MNSFIKDNEIVGVVALLVHASKLDENYTIDEKRIIKNFISNISKVNDPEKILNDEEKLEGNSNQILNFTKLIKNKPIEFKKKIILRAINFIKNNKVTKNNFFGIGKAAQKIDKIITSKKFWNIKLQKNFIDFVK